MRNFSWAISIVACLMLSLTAANAGTVNFDSFTEGQNIDGLNLGGVTITSLSGQTIIVDEYPSYVGYISAPYSVTNYRDDGLDFITPGNPMTFTFDVPTTYVSFTAGDLGGDADQFTVDLYDASSTLFMTITTPIFGNNPIGGPAMVDFYTFSYSYSGGIIKMVVRDAINAGIGIDNLEFADVIPEPTSLLLFGSGLGILGLAAYRRRRK